MPWFDQDQRQRVREAEPRWIPKFCLRIANIVSGILVIGLVAPIWASRILSGIWLLIVVVSSITWNLVNVVGRLTRIRPIHPGANVGCDLILWIAWCFVVVFLIIDTAVGLSFDRSDYYRYDSNYDTYTNDYGGYYRLDGSAVTFYRLLASASAFACVSLILHFALFVWACIDEHRRRTASSELRIAAALARSQQQPLAVWVPAPQGANQTGPRNNGQDNTAFTAAGHFAPGQGPQGQQGGYWTVIPQPYSVFSSARPSVPSAIYPNSYPMQPIAPPMAVTHGQRGQVQQGQGQGQAQQDQTAQSAQQDPRQPRDESGPQGQQVNLQDSLLQTQQALDHTGGSTAQQTREPEPSGGYYAPETKVQPEMKEKEPVRGYYGPEIEGATGPSGTRT